MDTLKTDADWTAAEAVVAEAKADLADEAVESNYNADGWAAIQAIITKANADLDAAVGDAAAIEAIVAAAKADIDAVPTAEEAAAAALAEAKKAAKDEAQAYYDALNYELYTDEAMATLTDLLKAVKEAIDGATTEAEVAEVVATYKTNVDAVEQIKPSNGGSGCGSVVDGGLLAGVALAAVAGVLVLRKKKED